MEHAMWGEFGREADDTGFQLRDRRRVAVKDVGTMQAQGHVDDGDQRQGRRSLHEG